MTSNNGKLAANNNVGASKGRRRKSWCMRKYEDKNKQASLCGIDADDERCYTHWLPVMVYVVFFARVRDWVSEWIKEKERKRERAEQQREKRAMGWFCKLKRMIENENGNKSGKQQQVSIENERGRKLDPYCLCFHYDTQYRAYNAFRFKAILGVFFILFLFIIINMYTCFSLGALFNEFQFSQ